VLVREMFDKFEKKREKIDKITRKERQYKVPETAIYIGLMYNDWALIRRWKVYVAYGLTIVASRSFRKYEDALRFYEKCVEEAKRRYEL